MKRVAEKTRRNVAPTTRRHPKTRADEEILRAATLELITHHGGHFVATGLRETAVKGFPVWIITVTLRYARGDEGYIGELLYDGEKFTFLTEQSVMDERARRIADDPEGTHKWNEYRGSTLRPRKA